MMKFIMANIFVAENPIEEAQNGENNLLLSVSKEINAMLTKIK